MDRLLGDGWGVSVVDNLRTGKRSNVSAQAVFHDVDMASPELTGVVEQEQPRVVFHLAAQTSINRSMENPVEDARINVLGTANLLGACVRVGIDHFVFMSTGGAIYGDPERVPCDEDHAAAPLSVYGASKLAAERYVSVLAGAAGLRYTILRPGNIYGPRQDPHGDWGVIAMFMGRMLAGEPVTVFGDGSQERDYVYVDDVVEAAMLAVTRAGADGPDTFNLGAGVGTSVLRVYDLLAQATGNATRLVHAPARDGEVWRIALDASRAERYLGWRPHVGIEEGIERTVAAFRRSLG